jgi:hypothetical protein
MTPLLDSVGNLSFQKRFITPGNIRRLAKAIIILAVLNLMFNFLRITALKESYLQVGYSNGYILVVSFFSIVTALVAIVASYGMLKYKEWGRQTTIVVLIVSFLIFAVNSWHSMQLHQSFVPMLAPFVFFFLLLRALSRPETLEIFSSET